MLVAGKHVHLFIWTPFHGADSFGLTLRFRRDPHWIHWRLILLQRNKLNKSRFRHRQRNREGQRLVMRGSLTIFELARWNTRNGTRERDDLKSYARLVVSPGGKRIQ